MAQTITIISCGVFIALGVVMIVMSKGQWAQTLGPWISRRLYDTIAIVSIFLGIACMILAFLPTIATSGKPHPLVLFFSRGSSIGGMYYLLVLLILVFPLGGLDLLAFRQFSERHPNPSRQRLTRMLFLLWVIAFIGLIMMWLAGYFRDDFYATRLFEYVGHQRLLS